MYTYEVNLSWNEDRKGTIFSPVLSQSIEVATPPEFPKGIEGIWSPEHLFVASVNACLMTTFLAIAENSKLEFIEFHSSATGTLDKVEGKFMMTEIYLRPTLTIQHLAQQEKALKVLNMSEKACLISNSVKSRVILEPTILIQEALVA
jgi:peroxiredoxin-like protein